MSLSYHDLSVVCRRRRWGPLPIGRFQISDNSNEQVSEIWIYILSDITNDISNDIQVELHKVLWMIFQVTSNDILSDIFKETFCGEI